MMSAVLQHSLSAAPSLEGEYCKNKARQTSSGRENRNKVEEIKERKLDNKEGSVFQFDTDAPEIQ